MKLKIAWYVMAGICFSLMTLVWAQNRPSSKAPDVSSKQNQDNDEDIAKTKVKIRELVDTNDLLGLAQMGNEIAEKWEKRGSIYYPYLLVEICGNIASQDFKNNEQYVLAKECAMRALKNTDKMLVEHELALVSLLNDTTEYTVGIKKQYEWEEDRRVRAKYWCHAWNKLTQEIDPNFSVGTDRPISRPIITDKETAFNRKYTRQKTLLRLKDSYSERLESFFINAYQIPPDDVTELQSLLKSCLTDQRQARRIINAVRKKTNPENQ